MIRLPDEFADRPEWAELGPRALALHVAALCYQARHATDGFVPAGVVAKLVPSLRRHGAESAALVNRGIWERVANGFRIVADMDRQDDAATIRERRRKTLERVTRHRSKVTASVTPLHPAYTEPCNAPPIRSDPDPDHDRRGPGDPVARARQAAPLPEGVTHPSEPDPGRPSLGAAGEPPARRERPPPKPVMTEETRAKLGALVADLAARKAASS